MPFIDDVNEESTPDCRRLKHCVDRTLCLPYLFSQSCRRCTRL